MLTFGTYISSWLYTTVKTAPTVASPFAGQRIAYVQTGTSGGHAMTLVG